MTTLIVAAAIFTFQNNFWVNLHQFLHTEASRRASGRAVQMDTALVEGYADVARRDLLRDRDLILLNDALSQVDGDTLPATIDPVVAAALMHAAPVYRDRFWPAHRQANAAWIATMQPIADRVAPALTQQLAKAYHMAWPSRPILIDVSVTAGPFGGYTTLNGPPGFSAHSTITPAGDGSTGDMSLETIFHEASHTAGPSITRAIAAESARQQLRPPANLWHAVIFYTTGELVRRALGKTADSHYMPYAYRFSVYEKGMLPDRASLEKNWQPWLDGTAPFEEALRNLVRDAAR
jgi:hypothetical protein